MCSTQIFLTADGYVGYRYDEDILGSTAPTVRSIRFSNEHQRQATTEEQAELVQALLAANVFGLASEPGAAADYFGGLDVRIKTQESRFFFRSPPRSPMRKAVHDIMLQFAKKMKIDQPAEATKATTITEGDRVPAQEVKLADVLAHPDEYHGKRVSVIGFYHGEFEGNSLSVDQTASRNRDYERSVWRSDPSSFADKSALHDRNNSWLRIDGVFLRGPGGHLGMWPGEIVRLTRIERVAKPR